MVGNDNNNNYGDDDAAAQLSHDVLWEVVLHLPDPRDVLNCRLVCKAWHAGMPLWRQASPDTPAFKPILVDLARYSTVQTHIHPMVAATYERNYVAAKLMFYAIFNFESDSDANDDDDDTDNNNATSYLHDDDDDDNATNRLCIIDEGVGLMMNDGGEVFHRQDLLVQTWRRWNTHSIEDQRGNYLNMIKCACMDVFSSRLEMTQHCLDYCLRVVECKEIMHQQQSTLGMMFQVAVWTTAYAFSVDGPLAANVVDCAERIVDKIARILQKIMSQRFTNAVIWQWRTVNIENWFAYCDRSYPWIPEAIDYGDLLPVSMTWKKRFWEFRKENTTLFDTDAEKFHINAFPPSPHAIAEDRVLPNAGFVLFLGLCSAAEKGHAEKVLKYCFCNASSSSASTHAQTKHYLAELLVCTLSKHVEAPFGYRDSTSHQFVWSVILERAARNNNNNNAEEDSDVALLKLYCRNNGLLSSGQFVPDKKWKEHAIDNFAHMFDVQNYPTVQFTRSTIVANLLARASLFK